jgi:putative ABC transport system permease protein
VGDSLTLKRGDDTHTFRIIGFMNGPGAQAYGHYETVSRLAGSSGLASTLRVATADTSANNTNALAEQMRKAFEDANIGVAASQSRATLIDSVLVAFDAIIALMIIVAALIAVVGGLGLAGTMSLSVMERTREVGVMRAVGAESPDLRFMFLFEGLCIGLMSAVIAFALSLPMSSLLGEMLGAALRQGAFAPQINLMGYGLWVVIVSIVSVAASLSPARRATRISIREALAYA